MIPRLHPRARRAAVALGLVWLACSWLKAGTIDTNTPVVVSMQDGQLHTHYINVRVNRDITHANRPRLFVHVGHALTDSKPGESDAYPLIELAREHTWTEPVKLPGYAAQDMPLTGTLLLFSLKGLDIHWFKPVIRVRPVLEWVESDGRTNRFVGPREVYVGHTLSAVAISGACCLAVAAIIMAISWHRTRGLAAYRIGAALCNPDGSLSLWRTQLAAWTLAIAWMVLLFGFMKLEVPEIPESLVALMGLALLTGGASAIKEPAKKDKKSPRAEPKSGDASARAGAVTDSQHESKPAKEIASEFDRDPTGTRKLRTRLGDLITNFNRETGEAEVSIAKVQMFAWTIATLALFVTKSLLDGGLWPVPWQLVALMGMSQAGYVAPKFHYGNPGQNAT